MTTSRPKKSSFCGLGLLCLSAALVLALRSNAAAEGKISVGIRGDHVSGVRVEVSGGDLTKSYERKASKSGRVRFTGLPAGTYTVTPRKKGVLFSPQFRTVTVTDRKTIGSRFKSSGERKKVGMAYCISCHASVSPKIYADWLAGPHSNFNYVADANHEFDYGDFVSSFTYPSDSTKFTGFPNASTIHEALKQPQNRGKSRSYCLNCHGPSSLDNSDVARFPLVRPEGVIDPVNVRRQVSRPIIGCEGCHGSGRTHISFPGKPVTHREPTAVQCGQCHNKNYPSDHLPAHPAGAAGVENPGIYEAYMASPHSGSINNALYTNAKQTAIDATCAKCHSDQGARLYRDIDGDATDLPLALAHEADHTEFAPVQCRTCHNPHNPKELLEAATAAATGVKARSAEFNTCTNCHQLLAENSDTVIAPYHAADALKITDSHYDDPATLGQEGYNVNRSSDSACSSCHNPHVAGVEINQQWRESGHGDLTGEAWMHYNWKGAERQACQRCHSPVGFANILADQENYNPAANDFSHLSGQQNETLYCYGCHTTDGSFKRRTIGANNGFVKFPSGDKVTLDPDSNLCMMCHQGRASKVDVDNKIATGTAITSFTNIHYYAAAATFFGTETRGGYEYDGKTYVGRNTFPGHQGTRNSCVSCHLRTDSADRPDHRFVPQVSDCSQCHGNLNTFDELRPASAADYDGDGDQREGVKGEITTLQQVLYSGIRSYAATTIGVWIVYDEAISPYWFIDANRNGVKDVTETRGYNAYDAKLLKAAYNYHMSLKEPHGFIHNYRYIVQLLFDSIEDVGADTSRFIRP